MSKVFRVAKINYQTKNAKSRLGLFHFNLKIAKLSLALLIVALGLGYLIQINGLATKGYQIRELEDRIGELENEQADLKLEMLGLQSMDNVENKVSKLNMVAAGQADYLVVSPVAVAR
ncbi:MAG: hypothetical protein RB292_02860 [Patescibacteria group bacterium]|jgi:hypothetical protein|nr:hypothetical protein [Patescibacteria group bacterium]